MGNLPFRTSNRHTRCLLQTPYSYPQFSYYLNDSLNQLTTTHPNARILLFGDFNFPSIDWQNFTPTSNEEITNFLDVCLNFNLTQLVKEPTRVVRDSSNILDLILTNHPESLANLTYLREVSDHKIIHATFTFIAESRQTFHKTIRLYDKGNYNEMNNQLLAFFQNSKEIFMTDQLRTTGLLLKPSLQN